MHSLCTLQRTQCARITNTHEFYHFHNQNNLSNECLYSLCTSQRIECAQFTKTRKLKLLRLIWLFVAEIIRHTQMYYEQDTQTSVVKLATQIDTGGLQRFKDLNEKSPGFY
jgi:hypothetical protein